VGDDVKQASACLAFLLVALARRWGRASGERTLAKVSPAQFDPKQQYFAK
jgi:hypothetical protein